MLTYHRELERYNENTMSALYGADLNGYLTAVVVVFCLLSLVPVMAALMKSYDRTLRVALRNAIGPIVAVSARYAIAQDPSHLDVGLLVLLLAVVGGLLVTLMSLIDVAAGTAPNDASG